MKIEYIGKERSFNISKPLHVGSKLIPIALYIISPGPISKTIIIAQSTIDIYSILKKCKETMPNGITKKMCIEAHQEHIKSITLELEKRRC